MNPEFDLQLCDCVGGMTRLPDVSVQLCITSPPYNLGISYSQYEDTQHRRDYLGWTKKWIAQVHRLLAEDGALFLNVGAAPSNPMLPHEILFEVKELFVLQNTIHWIKSITVENREGESISAGHFKPIQSKRFLTDCHEYVFHLTKHGNVPLDRLGVGVPYADKSNIKRWSHTGGRDRRCRGNTWFVPYETIKSRADERPHPATFPKALAKMCMKLHGNVENLVVLDPFLGIGSSALAAQDLRVKRFHGFEIDPAYFAIARERLGLDENRSSVQDARPAKKRRAASSTGQASLSL